MKKGLLLEDTARNREHTKKMKWVPLFAIIAGICPFAACWLAFIRDESWSERRERFKSLSVAGGIFAEVTLWSQALQADQQRIEMGP